MSDIGLRSFLISLTDFVLGRGDASASFHEFGKSCSLNEAFRMVVTELARNSERSFSIEFGMGQLAFAGFRRKSFL